MSGKFTINDTINTLDAIFEKHRNERICVLATTCAGKTTMTEKMPHWVDVDILLGERMTAEEIAFRGQVPRTPEIDAVYGKIMRERVKVEPGHPLFCSDILDCEVVVYVDISNDILSKHCEKRGVDFNYAPQMKNEIENDWNSHKEKNEKVFYYVAMAE
jgi:hypothetical protein